MHTDRFGHAHSSPSKQAVRALDGAVEGILRHGAETAGHLGDALRHDPGLPAAIALNGFAALILARRELVASARAAAAALRGSLAERGGTPRERDLCAALDAWAHGRMRLAAERLEAVVARDPGDLMTFKLAQTCRFMLGDIDGMLQTSSAVLSRRSADAPGQGYVFGCHAFGLEETGGFPAAEAMGRAGLERAPQDAWGLHAVTHVYEMTGRTGAGIDWLERNRTAWSHCNNFRFHVAWHLALFHLAEGAAETALALYDEAVRPQPTDDFRDIANASSLLRRMEQDGIRVGDRWQELGMIAARRVEDTTLVFASLHYLMVLLGCGRRGEAGRLAGRLAAFAETGSGDQARVARTIGLPLALALIEADDVSVPQQAVRSVGRKLDALQKLGGSHAQRDVFVRTLAQAARASRDLDLMRTILAERARMKTPDRFSEWLAGEAGRKRERTAVRHGEAVPLPDPRN